jgi:imidazolonepropionase-like amidohydrolase
VSRPLVATVVLALLIGCGPRTQGPASSMRSGPTVAVPSVLAVRHATLIDVEAGPPRPGMTIVVRGDRIERVGRDAEVTLPRDARIVDGRDRFVVPGLWDMHVHLTDEGSSALAMYVASGVTGVRDMGGVFDSIRHWRADIAAGRRVGPRIVAAGPMLESTESIHGIRIASHDSSVPPPDRALVRDAESAQRIVDSVAALGVDFIKIRTYENAKTYWAIAAAARRRGIALEGHPPFGFDVVAVADSGQRSFEHGFFPWKVDSIPPDTLAQIIRALKRNGIALVPTLTAWDVRRIAPRALADSVEGPAGEAHRWRSALSRSLSDHWHDELGRFAREHAASRDTGASVRVWNSVLDGLAHDMAVLRAAGVLVLPGSDLPVGHYPGEALHTELEALVGRGVMTSAQALESATIASARFLRVDDSVGTIAPGKIADLVLLDADPLRDIANLRRVHAVIAGGRLLADLGQLPLRAAVSEK